MFSERYLKAGGQEGIRNQSRQAKVLDLVPGPNLPEPDPDAPDVSLIEVELTGVDFKMLKTFSRTIKGIDRVTDVSRNFSDGVATFIVSYEGPADQLAEDIDEAKPDGVDLEITGFSDRRIEMAVK